MKEVTYKMKALQYDTWGNEKDGYDVNDVFTLIDELVFVGNDDTSIKELAKAFHNQKIFGLFGTDVLKIDFRKICLEDCYPFIEIVGKSNNKPLGRIEVEEV